MAAFVPRKGEFVAITFDPRSGHEQQGRRPALVVSAERFNRRMRLCIVCPVTNTARGLPTHIALPPGCGVTGFVMVEQVKSLDYHARGAVSLGMAPTEVLDDALAVLDAILY